MIGAFRSVYCYRLLILLGSNHLQYYVSLDDRANNLLTTTSVTQVPSDVYDNKGGGGITELVF